MSKSPTCGVLDKFEWHIRGFRRSSADCTRLQKKPVGRTEVLIDQNIESVQAARNRPLMSDAPRVPRLLDLGVMVRS
jgi:hypothetical protein